MTKPTKWHVHPAKTQISLGIRPVWSETSLSAGRKLGSLATHWAHSEDSDQTGRMPRLISVFAGCTVILLVLSWGGSFAAVQVVIRPIGSPGGAKFKYFEKGSSFLHRTWSDVEAKFRFFILVSGENCMIFIWFEKKKKKKIAVAPPPTHTPMYGFALCIILLPLELVLAYHVNLHLHDFYQNN